MFFHWATRDDRYGRLLMKRCYRLFRTSRDACNERLPAFFIYRYGTFSSGNFLSDVPSAKSGAVTANLPGTSRRTKAVSLMPLVTANRPEIGWT